MTEIDDNEDRWINEIQRTLAEQLNPMIARTIRNLIDIIISKELREAKKK